MTYAVLADMQKRFDENELIQLTDEAALGVIDSTAMTAALEEADNKINSYLSQVYTLPIAMESLIAGALQILVDTACDIARYRLYKTEVPIQVDARYKEALSWLKDVAAGKFKLVVAGGAEVAARDELIVMTSNASRLSRDSLRGY